MNRSGLVNFEMILLYMTFYFGICNKIGELAGKAVDRLKPVTDMQPATKYVVKLRKYIHLTALFP